MSVIQFVYLYSIFSTGCQASLLDGLRYFDSNFMVSSQLVCHVVSDGQGFKNQVVPTSSA